MQCFQVYSCGWCPPQPWSKPFVYFIRIATDVSGMIPWRRMLQTSNDETSHHLEYFEHWKTKILSDPPGCKEERSAAVSKVKQTWDWETQKASKQNCVEKHWHWHWHLSSCSILAPAFKSAATVPVWLFFTAQSNAVYPHLEDDEIMGTVSCSVSHVLVLDAGTGRNQGKHCVRVTPSIALYYISLLNGFGKYRWSNKKSKYKQQRSSSWATNYVTPRVGFLSFVSGKCEIEDCGCFIALGSK